MVCFDLVEDRSSWDKVKFWVEELFSVLGEDNVTVALVGCKADMLEEGKARSVPKVDCVAYARNIGATYLETSAKTGKHVDAAFVDVVRRVLARKADMPAPAVYDPNVLSLDSAVTRAPEKKKCPCR